MIFSIEPSRMTRSCNCCKCSSAWKEWILCTHPPLSKASRQMPTTRAATVLAWEHQNPWEWLQLRPTSKTSGKKPKHHRNRVRNFRGRVFKNMHWNSVSRSRCGTPSTGLGDAENCDGSDPPPHSRLVWSIPDYRMRPSQPNMAHSLALISSL